MIAEIAMAFSTTSTIGAAPTGVPNNILTRYLRDPKTTNHAVFTRLAHVGVELVAIGVAVALFAVVVVIVVTCVRRRCAKSMRIDAHVLQLAMPPEIDPDGAELFWATLHDLLRPMWKRIWHGQPHVVFEMVWHGAELSIQLWVPGAIPLQIVQRAISSSWPGVAINEVSKQIVPENSVVVGGELRLQAKEWFSIKADHDVDPLRAVIGAVGVGGNDQTTVVQVLARPVTGARMAKCLKVARQLRAGKSATLGLKLLDLLQPGVSTGQMTDDPNRTSDIKAITEKANSVGWEALVRYAVADTNLDFSRSALTAPV